LRVFPMQRLLKHIPSLCLFAAAGFSVVWVFSYYEMCELERQVTQESGYSVTVAHGTLRLHAFERQLPPYTRWHHAPLRRPWRPLIFVNTITDWRALGFIYSRGIRYRSLVIPFWFLFFLLMLP